MKINFEQKKSMKYVEYVSLFRFSFLFDVQFSACIHLMRVVFLFESRHLFVKLKNEIMTLSFIYISIVFSMFIVTFYSILMFCLHFVCLMWFCFNNCRILNSCFYYRFFCCCCLYSIFLFDLIELFLNV